MLYEYLEGLSRLGIDYQSFLLGYRPAPDDLGNTP